MESKQYTWIHADARMPEPIKTPRDRDMENAVLLYTPVDGMINVGWYLGPDYRGRPQWITASRLPVAIILPLWTETDRMILRI